MDQFERLNNDIKIFTAETEQTDDITLLELCHQQEVAYVDPGQIREDIQPAQWSMQFDLDIQSLRQFDILLNYPCNHLRNIYQCS